MQPINFKPALVSRRTALRAGAVSIALPFLDVFRSHGLHATTPGSGDPAEPRRLLLVARPLGYLAANFFPTRTGRDYDSTRYLRHLDPVREQLTVISGISHPGHNHHTSEIGFFTGAPRERITQSACCYGLEGVNNTVSLDNYVAARLPNGTRYSNLVIGGQYLQKSFTETGVNVPSIESPFEVFRRLFINGTPEEMAREVRRLQHGRSILDRVSGEARTMSLKMGPDDRGRMDQMFTTIRDTEKMIVRLQQSAEQGRPRVDFQLPASEPKKEEVVELSRLWFEIVRLAFLTDSTRVIMLSFKETGVPKVGDRTLSDHHGLSHHGRDETKIAELSVIEEAEMAEFGRFLSAMKTTREREGTLLGRTTIFHGSNLGDAAGHGCENLPIIVAGGGLRHQGHLAFDRRRNKNLSNLYVRLAQHMGVETERFGMSDGRLSEI
jgi:hypothetical protein